MKSFLTNEPITVVLYLCAFTVLLSGCGSPPTYIPGELADTVGTVSPEMTPQIVNPPWENASRSSAIPNRPTYPLTGIGLSSFAEAQAFDLLSRSGAYWLRINGILWSQVEPQRGGRAWGALADLEEQLEQAASLNSNTIVVVRSTPPWAQELPGSSCGKIRPTMLPAFADFMHDLVIRYSVEPYSVDYWEMWNEPDVDPDLVPQDSPYGCWGDESDPYYGGEAYAEMLKVVYASVKEGNPAAQVLVGGLLLDCDPVSPPKGLDCTPAKFLEGILLSRGGEHFDGVSFHGYDFYQGPYDYGNPNWHSSREKDGPVGASKSRYLRDLLRKHGYGDKFMIQSEAGLLCGRTGEEPACLSEEYDLTKAYYLIQTNAVGMAEGLRGHIWFSLGGWRGTALIGQDGSPLLAYQALRSSSTQLNGATFLRYLDDLRGIRGIEYYRDQRIHWVIWSEDGEAHLLQFASAPKRIFDSWGNPLPERGQVVISEAPVFIDWGQ